MSQIFNPNVGEANIPPEIPDQFPTDIGGPAVAAGHILNVFGSSTTANDVDGIRTNGSGNTVFIELTNRYTGTAATAGAVTATPAILSLASDGQYLFECTVVGYRTLATTGGVTYKLIVAVLRQGGIAKIIGTQDKFVRESDGTGGTTDLTAADANFTVTGADQNVSLTVTGAAGSTLAWGFVGTYTQQL